MTDSHPAPSLLSGRTAWARNLETPLRRFLRTETGSAAILLAATVAALVWANAARRDLRPVLVHPARGDRSAARACPTACTAG